MTETIKDVKARYSEELLAKSLVIGVGVGPKLVGGERTQENAIRVYVINKLREDKVDDQHMIPSQIEGIETDVIEQDMQEPTSADDLPDTARERHRPARPGCSISHYAADSRGTLGKLAKDEQTGKLLFLSNWHVLANCGMCREGDPILQPGGYDGGEVSSDTIGYLHRWADVRMLCSTQGKDWPLTAAKKRIRKAVVNDIALPENVIDAAAAKPISKNAIENSVLEKEKLPSGSEGSVSEPSIGDTVYKSGATTGVTSGTVIDTCYDTLVTYDGIGVALFKNQILTNGFGRRNPPQEVRTRLQLNPV